MAGITSFSAYVPISRMGQDTVGWTARNERAIASFDEDSLTMAVTAVMDCITDADRKEIDGVFFASTTSPYREKQAATMLATIVDLGSEVFCADIANSLRSGTVALRAGLDAIKAGSAKKVLVAGADMRIPQPRSGNDTIFGDGAVALVLGNSDVVAEVEDSYSISHEIQDVWRLDKDEYVRSSEDRFVFEQGYLTAMPKAISTFLARSGAEAKDFARVVFYAPDARRHRQVATTAGFDYKTQVQDPMFDTVGNTGTVSALMMLVAALEDASPGDRILLVSYGDGADVFSLRVTEKIGSYKHRVSLKGYLESKRLLPSYETYLKWRELLDVAPLARRPALRTPSAAAMFREQDTNLRLYGVRCKKCGCIQYPSQRVCTKCNTKDEFEPVRFSDKRATINTFSLDYLGATLEPPTGVCMIDFEGGGRMMAMITDRIPEEVKVGMPVEMTFRKLYTAEGIHNYYWKCMPIRI
jgi:hydroxymethylglutaryl-CoA synthase